MRIAVVGATGRSGREVVRAARERGHDVLAVIRTPARLTGSPVAFVTADAGDEDALAVAYDGCDAVIWCVGPVRGEAGDVMRRTIPATLAAVRTAGVERLVVITASGPFTEGDGWLLARVVKPVLGRMLRAAFTDLAAADAIVRASDAPWTIVRPPQLTGGRAKGYRASHDGALTRGYRITRADLAAALLDVVEDPRAVHAVVSVAG